jgi:hypothetical protein
VSDFLLQSSQRRFQWGVCDCCLFLADWIAWRDGIDPARHLRGTYASERAMRRLLLAAGGIEAVVADCARRAGLVPTSSPIAGDVGLVRCAIGYWRGRGILVPVGAICVGGGRWAIKPQRGLLIDKFPPIRAWGRHG